MLARQEVLRTGRRSLCYNNMGFVQEKSKQFLKTSKKITSTTFPLSPHPGNKTNNPLRTASSQCCCFHAKKIKLFLRGFTKKNLKCRSFPK